MSGAASAPTVGRFAPSPTGPLHFGSLVAALASYCDARAAGGRWLVRIEDVDEPRAVAGAERDILDTLARYGFAADGPVVRQSERDALYSEAIAALDARGLAYPCACTRRELEAAPLSPTGERVYPGTCRQGIPVDRVTRARRSIRVRVDDAVVGFVDRLQGPQRQDLAREVGDFVVRRSDGLAAYQLAVVVDDQEQGITDVVRGADLLQSTPRQILVQEALGLRSLKYMHVPLAVDAGGIKLSKSSDAPRIASAGTGVQLVAALEFLGQDPPDVLASAGVGEVLDWAVRNWQPAGFSGMASRTAPA